MGVAPRFSFVEQATIEAPASVIYQQAQAEMVRIEKQFGPDFYKNNAKRAYFLWQEKKPWWL